MSDKYTKVEPKIHPVTLIAIISFFLIIITLIFVFKPTDKAVIFAAYEPYATSDFTEDHPFVSVSYENKLFDRGLDKILDKEELVLVYVGSSACPSCQAHIGAIQKYYVNEGFDQYVSKIYYLNTDENADGFNKLIELFPEIEASTPQLLIFQNGELLSRFIPISSEDATAINRSVRDFYQDAIDLINAE